MDAIDQMLDMAQVKLTLDTRCLLAGEFSIGHVAAKEGEAAFHFVLAGRGRVVVDGRESIELSAGDFMLLPHGNTHVVENAVPRSSRQDSDRQLSRVRTIAGASLPIKSNVPANRLQLQGSTDLDLLCGHFAYGGGAGWLFTRWLPDILIAPLHSEVDSSLLDAMAALLRSESMGPPRPAANTVITGLGLALLGMALRCAMHAESAPSGGVLRLLQDRRMAPSIQALMDAPERPWSIDAMAERAAMSRATYIRHFQSLAGCSVATLVLQVRMMHACALLERGERNIADVAQAVGYASEASFATAFVRVMGTTPGRWRRDAS